MHASKRRAVKPYVIGQMALPDKTAVLSLIDSASGEVRSQIVANVDGGTLGKAIAKHVNMAGSTLHTDSWKGYLSVGPQFASHESVNNAKGEYVRHSVSTNMAEGYFSQLKRSIDGTHHHASDAHLPRYLARVRLPLYDPQGVGPRTVCDAHGASRRAPAHLSLNDRLVH